MTVIVTGAAGFLGYHVCQFYRSMGEDVVGIDNLSKLEYTRAGYNIKAVRSYVVDRLKISGVKFIERDIYEDGPNILPTSYKKGIDFVVHCAAQPSMTISIESPILDLNTNVRGTINVMNYALSSDAPMVNCSTIHVYGNKRSEIPTDETSEILRGTVTPLHASKLAAETYCRAANDTYGGKIANFRLSGMYGPMQFGGEDHGWIANFMIRHLLEKPITVFGTTKQYRDILYVDDSVQAIEAYRKRPMPGTYNVGGGERFLFGIDDLFVTLEEYTGREVKFSLDKARTGDMHYFCCDIDKIQRTLQWTPMISPDIGLATQFEWIMNNMELFK